MTLHGRGEQLSPLVLESLGGLSTEDALLVVHFAERLQEALGVIPDEVWRKGDSAQAWHLTLFRVAERVAGRARTVLQAEVGGIGTLAFRTKWVYSYKVPTAAASEDWTVRISPLFVGQSVVYKKEIAPSSIGLLCQPLADLHNAGEGRFSLVEAAVELVGRERVNRAMSGAVDLFLGYFNDWVVKARLSREEYYYPAREAVTVGVWLAYHELAHIFLDHFARARKAGVNTRRKGRVWNIAGDYPINEDIPEKYPTPGRVDREWIMNFLVDGFVAMKLLDRKEIAEAYAKGGPQKAFDVWRQTDPVSFKKWEEILDTAITEVVYRHLLEFTEQLLDQAKEEKNSSESGKGAQQQSGQPQSGSRQKSQKNADAENSNGGEDSSGGKSKSGETPSDGAESSETRGPQSRRGDQGERSSQEKSSSRSSQGNDSAREQQSEQSESSSRSGKPGESGGSSGDGNSSRSRRGEQSGGREASPSDSAGQDSPAGEGKDSGAGNSDGAEGTDRRESMSDSPSDWAKRWFGEDANDGGESPGQRGGDPSAGGGQGDSSGQDGGTGDREGGADGEAGSSQGGENSGSQGGGEAGESASAQQGSGGGSGTDAGGDAGGDASQQGSGGSGGGASENSSSGGSSGGEERGGAHKGSSGDRPSGNETGGAGDGGEGKGSAGGAPTSKSAQEWVRKWLGENPDESDSEQGKGQRGGKDEEAPEMDADKVDPRPKSSLEKRQAKEQAVRDRKARRRQRQHSGSPTGKGDLDAAIEHAMGARIDWRKVLASAIVRNAGVGSQIRGSFAKLSQRNRWYRRTVFPGMRLEETAILVAVDVSGSIDDEELSEIYSAIEAGAMQGDIQEIWVLPWDTEPGEPKQYIPGSGTDAFGELIKGGGGTLLGPALEACGKLVQKESHIAAVIVVTDGYVADAPARPDSLVGIPTICALFSKVDEEGREKVEGLGVFDEIVRIDWWDVKS